MQLLELEKNPDPLDENLMNTIFRAAHSIKGGAGFFGFIKVQDVGHELETILDKIRSKKIMITSEITTLLLQGFDLLRSLILQYETSNSIDISEIMKELKLYSQENVQIATAEKSESSDLPKAPTPPKGEKYVYSLCYPKGTDLSDALFAELQTVGEISSFNPESAEQELHITLRTVLEPDFVQVLTKLPAERVVIIKTFGEKKTEYSDLTQNNSSSNSSQHDKIEDRGMIQSLLLQNRAITTRMDISNKSEESSVRVNVKMLESLMNLAGELVLSRNQLIDSVARNDMGMIKTSSSHLSIVTSELQEVIMQTRMQPIGNILSKFPRVVREISGKLEGLSDPLVHMIRNAVDHGIEDVNIRKKNGKTPFGRVDILAYHEAGQVIIEIKDDGNGIDGNRIFEKALEKGLLTKSAQSHLSDKQKQELIFLPGLSTADEVTDLSGRGVGMDVVKSNIDKLGGKIEIESIIGRGSTFKIKLPLTLAIIPSLVVTVCKERYAIPQVNVVELIRIPAAQVYQKIEVIGNQEVLTLRGELLPVVHLAKTLGIPLQFTHPKTGEELTENRNRVVDRRSIQRNLGEDYPDINEQLANIRSGKDRRFHAASDINIAILSAGQFKYGLVVDELHDTLEIVVKPLDSYLKDATEFAGATIMGDGKVSLILDATGLAHKANLHEIAVQLNNKYEENGVSEVDQDVQNMLTFRNSPSEVCAVPLDLVARVEQISQDQIENLGGKRSMQYRGGFLPLVTLADTSHLADLADELPKVVIVFKIGDREAGLLASGPLDVVQTSINFDESTLKQKGISGSTILNEKSTLLIDIYEVFEILGSEWAGATQVKFHKKIRVLLAEDSPFFRNTVRKYLEQADFDVVCAVDGEKAWATLHSEEGEFDLLLTDIEMPFLTGLELTKRVRQSEFKDIPIIALTSLSQVEDRERGIDAGVDDYQIKLDRENLLKSIQLVLNKKHAQLSPKQ
jgi:two-component system chemotaxis sensor kinase CheA